MRKITQITSYPRESSVGIAVWFGSLEVLRKLLKMIQSCIYVAVVLTSCRETTPLYDSQKFELSRSVCLSAIDCLSNLSNSVRKTKSIYDRQSLPDELCHEPEQWGWCSPNYK